MYIDILVKYLVNGESAPDIIFINSNKIFNAKYSYRYNCWFKVCFVSLQLSLFKRLFSLWFSNKLVWHRTVQRNASKNRTKLWKLNCQQLLLTLFYPTSHLPPSCIDFTCKADWEAWKLCHVNVTAEVRQTHCNKVGFNSHIWILYLHHFDERDIKYNINFSYLYI